MTPARIAAIANEHLDAWVDSSTKSLRERVIDAITAALYEEGCQTGTAPHDINNPPFQRHCAPQHDHE